MSSIIFTADLDTSKLEAGIKRSNKTIGAWAQDVEKQTSSIDRTMQKVGGAMATYFSVRALAGFGREVINIRGQFQQLGIAFETMLGSKEKADKLMAEAITFAAKTPFTLTDVATNIKQLMAMGIETENVMDTMKALGDVAAGVSVPISRIAINYGQVATMGKLQGRELRDFAMAGVPLIDELSKSLGKSKTEIQDMVTAGQIGFPLVEAAFKSMAGEGGKFYNLMEKQNASVTGQISNLTDRWQVMLNNIGESNEGIIYGGISGLGSLVENYETVIEVIKGLVLVLGVTKVATMVVAHEQKIQAATTLLMAESNEFFVRSEARAIVMKQRSLVAQQRLNASILANPYVLAAAAVAALGFGLYKLITYQTDLEKAIEKADIEIENETDKVLDLFSALKATTEGTDEWEEARRKIIDQYGDLIPEQLKELKNLEDISDAQILVNKSLKENIALKTRTATLEAISEEYNSKIVEAQGDIVNRIEKKLGKERAATVKYELADLVAEYKAGLPGAEKALLDYRTKLMGEVGTLTAEGLGKSPSAVNMAAAFTPLRMALEGTKEDTELANKAFEEYIGTIKKDPKGKDEEVALTTAVKQRLELKKQLVIEEQKLLELETKPGVDPLKDIEDQKAVIKALEDKLDITDKGIKQEQERAKELREIEDEILAAKLENFNKSLMGANANKEKELKVLELKYKEDLRMENISEDMKKALAEKYSLERLAIMKREANDIANYIKEAYGSGTDLLGRSLQEFDSSGKRKTSKFSQDSLDYGDMNKLRKISDKLLEQGRQANKEDIEAAQRKIENQKQLITGAQDLVYLAGEQLGLDEEQLKILGDKLQMIGQFASGNYVGAAVTAVISVVSSFMSLIPDQSAKLDKQLESINQALIEQQRLIDLSNRKGGGQSTKEGELNILKEQLSVQEAALKKAQDYLDPNKFKLFRTQSGMKKAAQDVEDLTLAIQESQNAIEDANQELTDFITGGITENTIADSIAQGFREGKTSVDDFAQYMNDILLDAVMNIFKDQLLSSPQMKTFTDDLKLFMADQVLTPEEVESLKLDQLAIVNANKPGFDALTGGLSLTGGTNAGLSGQIARSITEDTGSELAGLFRRFADEQRVVKDYSIMGVAHLVGIESNTAETVNQLQLAVVELQSIAKNTGVQYGATPGV